jgi:hypothetical protein
MARRTTMALLGVALFAIGACHRGGVRTLTDTDRARLYAAVLSDLRRDSVSVAVVLDSLVPTADIDAEVAQGVMAQLSVSQTSVDAFRAAQRSGAPLHAGALPDSLWRTVSSYTLDSLRRAARSDVERGVLPRTPRNDPFWQHFQRTFPRATGYVVLSPAGVSRDGREALVYVHTSCGAVCGESELRLMRRASDGSWRTKSRMLVSMS